MTAIQIVRSAAECVQDAGHASLRILITSVNHHVVVREGVHNIKKAPGSTQHSIPALPFAFLKLGKRTRHPDREDVQPSEGFHHAVVGLLVVKHMVEDDAVPAVYERPNRWRQFRVARRCWSSLVECGTKRHKSDLAKRHGAPDNCAPVHIDSKHPPEA
jgi:hypothetical protein